jgi:hypothetical protein
VRAGHLGELDMVGLALVGFWFLAVGMGYALSERFR